MQCVGLSVITFLYSCAGGDNSNQGQVDAKSAGNDSGTKIGAGVGSGVVVICAVVVVVVILVQRKPTWNNKAKYVSKENDGLS